MTFRKCLSSSRSDCRDADRTDPNGKYNYIHNGIDEPGRYIATVHFAGGEEVRYGIVAESSTPHFYCSLRILEEKRSAVLDLGAETKHGRHVLPKNAEQVAAITRIQELTCSARMPRKQVHSTLNSRTITIMFSWAFL